MTDTPRATRLQRRTDEIEVEADPGARITGEVRWFSQEKGYGFLAPDDGGEEVFVRYSAIDGHGFRALAEGQRVSFAVGSDGRGPRASDVRVV